MVQVLADCPTDELKHYVSGRLGSAIRDHVLGPAWAHGTTPRWTNNNAESMNHILKQQTKWKLQNLPDLIDKLDAVVRLQEKELERSLVDRGDYIVAPSYAAYKIDPQTWCTMDAKTKAAKISAFRCKRKAGVRNTVLSSDGTLRVSQTKSAGKKPHQRRRKRAERTAEKH